MKELMAKRAKAFEQARALILKAEAEKRALTSEEQTEYDARMADVRTMGDTIQRSRESADMEAELNRSVGPRQDGQQRRSPGSDIAEAGLDAFLRGGVSDLNQEQRAMFGVTPQGRAEQITIRSASPLSAVTATAGVETVPTGFMNALEKNLKWFGGMRQSRARVIRTASGQPLPWPTFDDTSNVGALIAESAAIAQATTEMAFSSVTFGAYKYSSKLVLVPIELMQDSAFDVQALVAGALGERLGRIQNTHFTTGAGSTLPKGVVIAATSGLTGAAPTAITWAEIVKLEHSVDPAYRIGAEWMFNDSTASYLEQLVDNNGRPLLNESFASIANAVKGGDANAPVRYSLKGYPVVLNGDVASIAASAKAMLFGDFSKYVIRDVMDIMLVRFGETYMVNGQIGFVAFMRTDGNLVDAGSHPVKFLTQHA